MFLEVYISVSSLKLYSSVVGKENIKISRTYKLIKNLTKLRANASKATLYITLETTFVDCFYLMK